MLKILLARFQQGRRTVGYPDAPATLPDRFRGLPHLEPDKCKDGCRECADACPTDAIRIDDRGPALDMGRCLFCTDCVQACPEGALSHSRDHRLAARAREGLVVREDYVSRVEALSAEMRGLFGRSLK